MASHASIQHRELAPISECAENSYHQTHPDPIMPPGSAVYKGPRARTLSTPIRQGVAGPNAVTDFTIQQTCDDWRCCRVYDQSGREIESITFKDGTGVRWIAKSEESRLEELDKQLTGESPPNQRASHRLRAPLGCDDPPVRHSTRSTQAPDVNQVSDVPRARSQPPVARPPITTPPGLARPASLHHDHHHAFGHQTATRNIDHAPRNPPTATYTSSQDQSAAAWVDQPQFQGGVLAHGSGLDSGLAGHSSYNYGQVPQPQPAPSPLDHPDVRELVWSMQVRIAHLEGMEHERLSAMARIQSVTDQMRGQTERDMAALNRDTKSLWEKAAHDHNRIEYLFNAVAAHVTLLDDLKINNDQERWKRNSLVELIDRLKRDHQSERTIAHEAMSRIHMRLDDSAKCAIQAERALAHKQQKSNILGDAIRDVTEFQRVDRQKMSDLEGEVQELKKQISRLHAMRQSGDYATSDIWKSPPAGAAPQLPENLELPTTKPDSTLAGSVGGRESSGIQGPTPPILQVDLVRPASIAGRSSVTVPAGDVFSRTIQPVPRMPPSKPIEPTRSEIFAPSGTRQPPITSSTEAAVPPSNRSSGRSTHDNSRRSCSDNASQLVGKAAGPTGQETAPQPDVTIDVDQLVDEHFKSSRPPDPKQPIAAPGAQSQIASSASGKPTIPSTNQRGIIRLQEPVRALNRNYRFQHHVSRQTNRPVEPRIDDRDTAPPSIPAKSREDKLTSKKESAPAVKVSMPSVQPPSGATMSVKVVPLRPTADQPAVLLEPPVPKATEVKTASVLDPHEPAQIIVAKVEHTADVVSRSDVQIQPIVESIKPVSTADNASLPAKIAASPQNAVNLSEQSTADAITKPSLETVTVFNALKDPASMHQGIDQAPEQPKRVIKLEIAPTVPTSNSKAISETPILIRSTHDISDTPESPSVQTPYTGYKGKGKWKCKGKGQASQTFRLTALGTPTRSGFNNQVGSALAKGLTSKGPEVAGVVKATPPKRSILGKGRFETLMSGDENSSVTSEDEEPDAIVDKVKLPESTTPTNKTKGQSPITNSPKESWELDESDGKLPFAALEAPVSSAAEETEKPSELSIMDESDQKLPLAALEEQLLPDVTEEPEKPAEPSLVDESDGKLPIVALEEPVLNAPGDSEETSELSIVDRPNTVLESSRPTPDDDARPESEAPEADNETLPCDDANVDASKDSTSEAKVRKSAKNAAKKKKQKAQKKIEKKTTPEHDPIFDMPKGYVPRLDDEFIDTVLNLHMGEDVEEADTTYDPDAIQRMASLDDRTLRLIDDVSMTRLRLATSKDPKDKTERARLARFFNIMFKQPVVYDPPTPATSTSLPPMEEGLIGLGLGGNGLGAAKPGSTTDRLNKLSLAGPLSSVPMTRTSDPFAARRPPADFVSFASTFGTSLAGPDKAETTASQSDRTAAGLSTPMTTNSRDVKGVTTLKSGFLQTKVGLSGDAPSTPSVTIKPPTYEESISATPDLLAKYAHAPITRRFQRTPSPSKYAHVPMTRKFQRTPSPSIAKATPPSASGSGAVATSSPGGSPWSSLLPFASSLDQGPTLPAYKQTKEEQATGVSEAEEERKRTAAKTLLYMRLVPMCKTTESPIDAAGGSSSSKISSPGGEVPDCQLPQTGEELVDESNASGNPIVIDPSSIPLPISSDDEETGTPPSRQEMAEHVQNQNQDRNHDHGRDQETAFDLFSPRPDLLNQFVAVSAVINPQLVEGPIRPGDTTTSKVKAADGATAIDSEGGSGENRVETGSKD